MKLTPLEQPETDSKKPIDTFVIEEHDDGSVSFTLVDGTPVTLHEILTEDITKIEQFSLANGGQTGSTAIALKLISLLCIKWGDKSGITYEELVKTPVRKLMPDMKRINKVFEFFRLDDLFDASGD